MLKNDRNKKNVQLDLENAPVILLFCTILEVLLEVIELTINLILYDTITDENVIEIANFTI